MTEKSSLLSLAERVEAAGAGEQREMLESAFRAIHGEKPARIPGGSPEWLAWLDRYNPFHRMLEAKAYESAALSLVPEGWRWQAGQFNIDPLKCSADLAQAGQIEAEGIRYGTGLRMRAQGKAATPALALTAACLRAISGGKSE